MRLLMLVACGCGRIGFDGERARDAPLDAAACTFGPFGAPRMIAELATGMDEWGPWLSADHRELYFSRGMGLSQDNDLFRASRASASDPFGPAIPLTALNSAANEEDPYVSPDGLTIYFDRDVTHIYRATRTDPTVEFANPVVVAELDAPGFVSAASLAPDQRTVVFDGAPPGGKREVYIALRPSVDDAFDLPGQLSALVAPGFDGSPAISPDGSMLLFVTDRYDPMAIDRRIAVATLDSTGGFGAPAMFGPIAPTDNSDVDPYLTEDGTTLVFASDRSGGPGGFDLYLIERACL